MKKRNNLNNKPICSDFSSFEESCRHPCIYVEGRNDYIVYYEVKNDGWNIFYDTKLGKHKNSKNNIIKAIEKRKNNNFSKKGFIGIVDKDYDEIKLIDKIYYTDFNDLECMAINYLEQDEIYNCLVIRDKINFSEFSKIIDKTLIISKELSSLWKYVNDNNIKFNYKCPYLINSYRNKEFALFKNLLDKNFDINYYVLLDMYKKINKLFYNMDLKTLKNIMKLTSQNGFRGHDFFLILSYILKENNIINTIDVNKFEENFIKRSNNKHWIAKSYLYKDVKTHGIFK